MGQRESIAGFGICIDPLKYTQPSGCISSSNGQTTINGRPDGMGLLIRPASEIYKGRTYLEKGKAKQKLLYTIKETAEVLSCSEKTVSRLIHSGALPTIRLGTRRRIPCVAIQEWLDTNTRYNSKCAGSVVQGASTCHILSLIHI